MKTKHMVFAALLIALSFLGSYVKIFGTIAFDSLPGFFGALFLGPVYGAVIGLMGHLFTALLSGFPYGLLLHGIIALSMALTMAGTGLAYRLLQPRVSKFAALPAAVVVGVMLNGPVSFAISYPFLAPMMGKAGALALLPILTVAGAANAAAAAAVYAVGEKAWARVAQGRS